MTTTDVDERSGLFREVDGRSVRSWLVVAAVIAVVTLGFGTWWTYGLDRGMGMAAAGGQDAPMSSADGGMAEDGVAGGTGENGDMGGMMSPDAPPLPPVFAYHDGEPIAFVHPEVSDPEIAELLTGMMGSPVFAVPALADVPDDATATLYLFTNGMQPSDGPAGPLGFQPDVFDAVPGDLDYTPLRRVVEVTWNDESQARLLTAAEDVEQAAERGLVELTRTDVVVNAPVLEWAGGSR